MAREMKKRSYSMPYGTSLEGFLEAEANRNRSPKDFNISNSMDTMAQRSRNFEVRSFSYKQAQNYVTRPRTSETPRRRRSLSEHGKSLLVAAFTLEELMPKAKVKEVKPKKVKKSKAKKKKTSRKGPRNYFDILSGVHEKEVMKSIKQKTSHRRKAWKSDLVTENGTILEDTVSDDDGWQTVSRPKPKAKKPKPLAQQSEPHYVAEELQEYDDMSELQYMEGDISDARVWGRDKKSRQWKAVQQRNYAMAKRDRQRQRS